MDFDGGFEVNVEEEVQTPRTGQLRQAPGTPTLPSINNSLQIIQDDPMLAAKLPSIVQMIERGCGPEEAQRFADSLRSSADVGNETVHIIEGIVRAMNKSLNLKDQQIQEQLSMAARSQRTAVVSSIPTAQEKSTRRKMLSERLPPLVKGTSIALWIDNVKVIIRQDAAGMSAAEILDAVKKAARHNNEVALTIDSAVANRMLSDVHDLFLVLTRLFSPDFRAHLAALRAKKQRDNQPAAEYMKEVRDIGYVHWVGLPEKPETFDMIINNMSEKHRAFVRDKWNTMHVAMQAHDNPNPITFAHLMNWALDSDAEYATNQHFKKADSKGAGRTNNMQGENDKDKKQFNDGRNHNYRGRGRGSGRG
eukprot:jgi/Botrbrau1/10454/Bobra.0133s0061.1